MKNESHLSNRHNQNILLANGSAHCGTIKNIYTNKGDNIGQILCGKKMYTVREFARSCWSQVTLKHERSSVANHNNTLSGSNYYNRNSKRDKTYTNRRISPSQSITSLHILKDLYQTI